MSEPLPSASSSGTPLRVAVTGATGLIGTELVRRLRDGGHTVVRLVRSQPKPGSGDVRWDPDTGEIDAAALEGLDAAVHLAGESVGQRWTAERKARIRRSRVEGTRLLAQTLAERARPPRVLVSASAVGFYGDRDDETLDEESAGGGGFLAAVTREWETAAAPARRAGIRVAHPRFGVVLSTRGGALARMLPPFRLGAGGKLGSGRQWMSWISLDDAVRALLFAVADERVEGPFNVTAPEPVTNAVFTGRLAHVLGRPALVPVPEFALRLAFGEMADEALLASQRALPRRLERLGFPFHHREVEAALRAALAE